MARQYGTFDSQLRCMSSHGDTNYQQTVWLGPSPDLVEPNSAFWSPPTAPQECHAFLANGKLLYFIGRLATHTNASTEWFHSALTIFDCINVIIWSLEYFCFAFPLSSHSSITQTVPQFYYILSAIVSGWLCIWSRSYLIFSARVLVCVCVLLFAKPMMADL